MSVISRLNKTNQGIQKLSEVLGDEFLPIHGQHVPTLDWDQLLSTRYSQPERLLLHILGPLGRKRCLHYAVLKRDVDLVRSLLAVGASPNVVDDSGDSLLLLAIRSGKIKIVSLLINAGVDVDYVNHQSPKNCPKSTLHDAVDADCKIVELLLINGANPNQANRFGMSVLTKAIKAADKNSSVLRLLLKHGADMYDGGHSNSISPFQELLLRKSEDGVRMFLENGFDYRRCKISKWSPTPLHQLHQLFMQISCDIGSHEGLLNLLIDHFKSLGLLDLNRVIWQGCPLLHYVVKSGQAQHVKILLEAGADPNVTEKTGRLLLENALSARGFTLEKIPLIVEAGTKLGNAFDQLVLEESRRNDRLIRGDIDQEKLSPYMVETISDYKNRRIGVQKKEMQLKYIVKHRILFESKCSVVDPIYQKLSLFKEIQNYYESCKSEITQLQKRRFHNSITYYTVLMDPTFWTRTRTGNPYETFNLKNLDKKFPIYCIDLRTRFLEAKSKHELRESALTGLKRLLGIDIDTYYYIYSNILIHLRKEDLRRLGNI